MRSNASRRAIPGARLRIRVRLRGHRPSSHKAKRRWTNGQVERMNRTIKEATVQRYHYGNHDQLRQHLDDFV